MKAGEGASDLVQYHPTPGSSKNSGVVEAEVSPPKDNQGKTKGFARKYMKTNPMITKEELNEGLQNGNEAVRAAALKLNMLILCPLRWKFNTHPSKRSCKPWNLLAQCIEERPSMCTGSPKTSQMNRIPSTKKLSPDSTHLREIIWRT